MSAEPTPSQPTAKDNDNAPVSRASTPKTSAGPPLLDDPSLFVNRELSSLEFILRVLEQARDPQTPLLERLRFLCISSSNLDEFFEVRVAGLIQQQSFGAAQIGPDGLSVSEVLTRISQTTHELVKAQYQVLNDELLPALEREGIRFLRRDEWNRSQARWIREYFDDEIVPIISPLRLDPAHPFPRVLNKGLHFIVMLSGEDAFGQSDGMAVVQAPRPLPRLIKLPPELSKAANDFVFLSSVLHSYMHELFPGMEVTGCYQFRVTRNSELFVDTEEVDDLLRALEGELPGRRYGEEVRLEVADNCTDELVNFLVKRFGLLERDVYRVNGPVNLHRLMALSDVVERPDLSYPGFTSSLPRNLSSGADIFEAISAGDILLHHPYQSFAPVVDMVRQAAADPQVLAIKQTLYRTGPDSVMVESLLAAARAGKEVTVVVELRARFDEQANITLASKLQEAGAHVVYGVVGYKTHAKMLLIVRREGGKLRRYIHLGTGNYHTRTARQYTDFGLLTADTQMGQDVHRIFMQLTSLGATVKLKRLLESPFTLHRALIEFIDREAENALAGRPSGIKAKMNALVEAEVIQALYRASQAGVPIDLIVRGVCALRPGVPGISETIRVRSLVGRFLEHARVCWFENDGESQLFCSSADWMNRNLHQRVETCFPILDAELSARVLQESLDLQLRDNTQAWLMQAGGSYKKVSPMPSEEPVNAQSALLEILTGNNPTGTPTQAIPKRFRRRGKM
ncbi:MAG: polyphosphate kinase [Gammaproteobacteria bacterium]|jgi:polyphosphate kinase